MKVYRRLILAATLALVMWASPATAQCNRSMAGRAGAPLVLQMPGNAEMLSRFGIAPTDSFALVTDALLCRRAVAEIVRDAKISADSFTIVLARTGAYYVAESDREMPVWGRTFVFDSTMALFLPRDTLVSFSTGAVVPPPLESMCLEPDGLFNVMVLGKIRGVLANQRSKWYRELLGLEPTPADSVHMVTDRAVCARAITAIVRHRQRPGEHVEIGLFRVGRFHWAELTRPRGGEWNQIYILDDAATKVLGQY